MKVLLAKDMCIHDIPRFRFINRLRAFIIVHGYHPRHVRKRGKESDA